MQNYELGETIANADKKEVLRDAMKTFAEEAKNQLSFKDHEDIFLILVNWVKTRMERR